VNKDLSDLYLVLVVQNLQLLSVLQRLRLLAQLELEQGVRDHADADIDRTDIGLNRADRFLNVLEGRVVRERLARVVDLPGCRVQAVVNFVELRLEFLNALADHIEVVGVLLDLVGLLAVVASLALEGTSKKSFLSCDLVKSPRSFFLELLKLDTYLWERSSNLVGVLLGLFQVGSPGIIIALVLVDFEFVGDSLHFNLPLLSGDC